MDIYEEIMDNLHPGDFYSFVDEGYAYDLQEDRGIERYYA